LEADEDLYVNDTTPLDEEETEEAKVIIAKNHPLINTPLHQAFPVLGKVISCCLCCVNKDKRREKMAALRKLMDEEMLEMSARLDKTLAE
jgi:hypothetical protein